MRRLAPFVIALAVYVTLAVVVKSFVLNWIVGPLFLLIVLDLLPRAFGRRPFFTLDAPVPAEDPTVP